jgi:glycosyltransferase involved in cell wall biosynthesis
MSENKNKLVSVIMAYYNGKKYFEEAIASVVNQTHKNIEIFVVDDASTEEGTEEFFESLKLKYDFTYIKNEFNLGASKSLDNITKMTNGEYIAYLSQDDIWVEDKLEHQLNKMESDNLDVLFSNSSWFKGEDLENAKTADTTLITSLLEDREKLMKYMFTRDDLPGNCLIQSALFKRKVIIETSWVRNRFLLDDWPLTVIFWRDYNTSFDPKVSFYYRIHDTNTHKDYWKWLAPRLQVIAEITPDEYKLEGLSFIIQSFVCSLLYDRQDLSVGISKIFNSDLYAYKKFKPKKLKDKITYKLYKKTKKKLIKKGIL